MLEHLAPFLIGAVVGRLIFYHKHLFYFTYIIVGKLMSSRESFYLFPG